MSPSMANDLDSDVFETRLACDAMYRDEEEFATSTVTGSCSSGAALQGTHS